MHADFRGNLVGRVLSRGKQDVLNALLISSPTRTSRDGFTLLPPIFTCPALQASVASDRLL